MGNSEMELECWRAVGAELSGSIFLARHLGMGWFGLGKTESERAGIGED